MLSDEKLVTGRFYGTFKVHKNYEHGTAPPLRGIVSCSGTMMENIAIYVEHHLKEIGKSHESYLEDTPDFLRHVEEINKGEKLPDSALLVVIDAIGLYNNIPPNEGVKSVAKALEEKPTSKVPSGFITRLLQIILEYSVFEFNEKTYQQQFGTTMCTKLAPPYANVFMVRNIDLKLWKIAEKYKVNGEIPMKHMKRFLDDIF